MPADPLKENELQQQNKSKESGAPILLQHFCSFECSFENFLNKTITKIFKGLSKGLFKGAKFCIVIGTLISTGWYISLDGWVDFEYDVPLSEQMEHPVL